MIKKAEWVWGTNSEKNDTYYSFFDKFLYEKNKAFLTVSAETDYCIYINNQFVCCGQYPDYPFYKVCDKIDITNFLIAGENKLEVIGYYMGDDGFSTNYPQTAGVIYEITNENNNVILASGKDTVCTDTVGYINGKCRKITSQLGYTYSFDARKIADKEKSLSNAVVIKKDKPHALRPIKKTEIHSTLNAKLIKTLNGETNLLYDLGKEEVGFLTFKLKANVGDKITVLWGEHIADGEVRGTIGERNFSIEYTAIQGEQDFTGYFRRLGARYLQVKSDSKNVSVESIGLKPVIYPIQKNAFDIKDTLRKQIYDTSVQTLQLCMHDHYEDCPWREQALYAMDARNQMLCGYYAFTGQEFEKSNLQLMSLDNRSDNLLAICFPSQNMLAIPSFSLFYIIAMNEYLAHTNDIDFIKTYYSKMESVLNVFLKRINNDNGLVKSFPDECHWNFYEWTDGLSGEIGTKTSDNEYETAPNALLSIALKNMAEVCSKLNKTNESQKYLAILNQVNAAINNRFFDSKANLYQTSDTHKGFSEYVNSLCIVCGAAGEKAEKIASQLVSANNMTNDTLSTACFKYDALLLTNKQKYAKYVIADIDKKYGYMLDNGATAFWETLDGESAFGKAGSLCHGWSAMPVYYYHILKEYL